MFFDLNNKEEKIQLTFDLFKKLLEKFNMKSNVFGKKILDSEDDGLDRADENNVFGRILKGFEELKDNLPDITVENFTTNDSGDLFENDGGKEYNTKKWFRENGSFNSYDEILDETNGEDQKLKEAYMQAVNGYVDAYNKIKTNIQAIKTPGMIKEDLKAVLNLLAEEKIKMDKLPDFDAVKRYFDSETAFAGESNDSYTENIFMRKNPMIKSVIQYYKNHPISTTDFEELQDLNLEDSEIQAGNLKINQVVPYIKKVSEIFLDEANIVDKYGPKDIEPTPGRYNYKNFETKNLDIYPSIIKLSGDQYSSGQNSIVKYGVNPKLFLLDKIANKLKMNDKEVGEIKILKSNSKPLNDPELLAKIDNNDYLVGDSGDLTAVSISDILDEIFTSDKKEDLKNTLKTFRDLEDSVDGFYIFQQIVKKLVEMKEDLLGEANNHVIISNDKPLGEFINEIKSTDISDNQNKISLIMDKINELDASDDFEYVSEHVMEKNHEYGDTPPYIDSGEDRGYDFIMNLLSEYDNTKTRFVVIDSILKYIAIYNNGDSIPEINESNKKAIHTFLSCICDGYTKSKNSSEKYTEFIDYVPNELEDAVTALKADNSKMISNDRIYSDIVAMYSAIKTLSTMPVGEEITVEKFMDKFSGENDLMEKLGNNTESYIVKLLESRPDGSELFNTLETIFKHNRSVSGEFGTFTRMKEIISGNISADLKKYIKPSNSSNFENISSDVYNAIKDSGFSKNVAVVLKEKLTDIFDSELLNTMRVLMRNEHFRNYLFSINATDSENYKKISLVIYYLQIEDCLLDLNSYDYSAELTPTSLGVDVNNSSNNIGTLISLYRKTVYLYNTKTIAKDGIEKIFGDNN